MEVFIIGLSRQMDQWHTYNWEQYGNSVNRFDGLQERLVQQTVDMIPHFDGGASIGSAG
jgi:hypothetical protein